MTDRLATSPASASTLLNIDWTRPVVQLACFAGLFLLAVAFNDALGWLNTDASWLILAAHRVLDGERLYVDVWDTNPPFSVLLYLPMAWLERLTGLRAEIWTSLALFAALSGSLWLSGAVLRHTGSMSRPLRFALLLALAVILLFAMPREFAQREHFGIILTLPLLLIYGASVGGRSQLPVWLSVLAGACAAVVIIVKPHYALGYALPAVFILSGDRDWRFAFQPAHFAGAALVIVYGISVFAAFPAFISDVLPLVAEFYLPRRLPAGDLMRLSIVVLGPAFLVLAILRLKAGAVPRQAAVFALAGLGFWLAFWWNGKGWAYHLWPALVAFYTSAALWFAQEWPMQHRATGRFLLTAALACFVLSHFGLRAYPSRDLAVAPEIAAMSPAPSMAVIGSDIGVGNPLARSLGADWRERENADLLAALAWMKLQKATRPEKRAELEGLINGAVERKTAYIASRQPDLILLDTKAAAVMGFMFADLELQNELLAYRPVGCSHGVSFLVRSASWTFEDFEAWHTDAIEACG